LTHILESYRGYLDHLKALQKFASESMAVQIHMAAFSLGLRNISHQIRFKPKAYAEKPDSEQSYIRIAEDASIPR
jgi:hypothetical protein